MEEKTPMEEFFRLKREYYDTFNQEQKACFDGYCMGMLSCKVTFAEMSEIEKFLKQTQYMFEGESNEDNI